MIQLTRLDGSRFYLNAELIETVEAAPDTHIMLTNGHRYVVSESALAVADLALRCRQRAHLAPMPERR